MVFSHSTFKIESIKFEFLKPLIHDSNEPTLGEQGEDFSISDFLELINNLIFLKIFY